MLMSPGLKRSVSTTCIALFTGSAIAVSIDRCDESPLASFWLSIAKRVQPCERANRMSASACFGGEVPIEYAVPPGGGTNPGERQNCSVPPGAKSGAIAAHVESPESPMINGGCWARIVPVNCTAICGLDCESEMMKRMA